MILNLSAFDGYSVHGLDGELGRLRDVYFDDFHWTVRYLVVELEENGANRPALIAPYALERVDREARAVTVHLDRAKVLASPTIRLDRPISLQDHVDLHNDYGWPFDWGPTSTSGVGAGNLLASHPLIESQSEAGRLPTPPEQADDQNLRSLAEVTGYHLQARDGQIGRLDDLLANTQDWNVLYLVVDAGGWLGGRKVLLSPTWIEAVDWAAASIRIDLSWSTIQNSPAFDPAVPFDDEYTQRLSEHYGERRDC